MHSVRRDPFARGEYIRYCQGKGKCAFCGQQRKRVYAYAWTPDDRRIPQINNHKSFCNLQCFDDYSGR